MSAVKKWNSSGLPKEQNADWNLGLASFSCAIQKQRGAKLNLSQTAIISLNYFSIVKLFDTSQLVINDGALLDLKDQSEFAGKESSNVAMEPGSLIELHSSRIVPGAITMSTKSKILLKDSRLTSLLAMLIMQQGSTLTAEAMTQITFIGGSKMDIGKNSSMTLTKSMMTIGSEVTIGQSCLIDIQNAELTVMNGVLNIGKKVEFKMEIKSAFMAFNAHVDFTEGAKIELATHAEVNMDLKSSLIMARRDLRLRIKEKGLLRIEAGAHCLMTADLTITKESTKNFTSSTNADSFRCFSTLQKLMDEKQQHFPDN